MSRPLTIAHVYKSYPPVRGGIEGHVDLLTRLLAERGLRPIVFCAAAAGAAPAEERRGVRVQRCFTAATIASTPLPPFLPWALWRCPADVVHLHYPWPPGELAWWLGGRDRPLVVTVHCEVIRFPGLGRLLHPLTRHVLKAAARIVVSSDALRQTTLLAPYERKVQVIPFGVDLDHFRPDPSAPDPIPEIPHPRVMFVGRLRYYKGLAILAAALARLPQTHLVVVGDGPEREDLEHALRLQGCSERAHLLGEVGDDTLLRLLQTADAAVLPSTSRAEAFGLSIAEAQACGVPAVTTDVGTGTTQTVADGVSGRVVAPSDAAVLAEALAWCLDANQTSARRVAARAHAESNLSAQRMAAALYEIYRELAP
jgi:glycosyltransferase involved in cell wall biosynthesis